MQFRYFDAVLWSAGTTFATMLLLVSLANAKPSIANDLVLLGGLQVLVYVTVCALFAWRRQGWSFSELFALRGSAWLLFAIALLLGVALHGPAGTLADLVERVAPMPADVAEEMRDKLLVKSAGHAIALFFVAAAAVPFVEELLYRGALFTALRPAHGAIGAAGVTALCFTLSHGEPRQWPPILVLAAALAFARAASGSMWASVLLHGAFNATSVVVAFMARDVSVEVPLAYEVGAWAASALLLGGFVLVARKSERAAIARAADEIERPAAAGES